MRYSIAILGSFAICIVGFVTALKFIEPLEYKLREKYGLTMDQLKQKCDNKDKSLYGEISAMQETAGNVRAELTHELVKKAKEKDQVTKDDWNNWIQERCASNTILKDISKSVVDKIQLCVDEKDVLNEENKLNTQQELLKKFCWAVELLANHEYQASKLENSGMKLRLV